MQLQRLLSILFLLVITFNLSAQETTSTISGIVTDDKGTPVSGASVLINLPSTGFSTGSQTNSKGIFVMPNLKPGGPYTISISFVGFKTEKTDNLNLMLGNNPEININLKTNSSSLQEVVVAGGKKVTPGMNISRAQINSMPTLGRSINDFTRLTPQSNNNSFAGTNFRYNNVTIDGSINNDAFGFSNSAGGVSGGGQAGTAGSGTRTNPYSLDVIQEVRVQIAP